jgi:hypothetical protein
MRFLTPLTVVVVTAVTLAGAACGSDANPPAGDVVALAGETVSRSRLVSIAAGICDAAELATGDVNSARATFFGQSHEGLHLIARGLEQEDDRATSAALLEAKQKVEADFLATAPGPQVAADLRRLADVTRSGLAGFKVSATACPQS